MKRAPGFAQVEIILGILVVSILATSLVLLYKQKDSSSVPHPTASTTETPTPTIVPTPPTATPTPFPSPTPWPTTTPNPYPIEPVGQVNIHILRFIDENNDDFDVPPVWWTGS